MMLYKDYLPQNPPVEMGIAFDKVFLNRTKRYFLQSWKEGRNAVAMDVKYGGPAMDLMTPQGFVTALWNTCRLAPGSGCLAAPVCSSFVYMTLGCFPKHAVPVWVISWICP